jgi:hypothetical protein
MENVSLSQAWLSLPRRQGQIHPIAETGCRACHPGPSEQIISLFTEWKMRGSLSDPLGERCDAILERCCLIERGTLHSASPRFGGRERNQAFSSPMDGQRAVR